MKIFDYLGRMFNPKTVGAGQQQTAMVSGGNILKGTFAGHPMRGLTPSMLNTIFDQAERGNLLPQHELYLDMEERDPHLHAEISKRKRTVMGLPRKVAPPPKATKADLKTVAVIEDIIAGIPNFDEVLLNLLDAVGHGFSCQEITWAKDGRLWVPSKIDYRPQYWFQLDSNSRSEIRLRDMSVEGESLWPFGWIVHIHSAKSSELARSGLYRILAWPWLMKQYSLRDLAEYLEVYGLPVKIGKYPRSAPEDDKDNLYRALQQLGRNAAGIMPDDMSVDFLKESLGSADPFMRMVEYCDSVISIAILGQTLSSSAQATGLGSGVAGLHGDVRQDLMEADAMQLASTITKQLIYPLVALNGFDTSKAYSYTFDTASPSDLNSFADSVQKLVSAGVPMPVEWVRKKAGVPEPEEGQAIIGTATTKTTEVVEEVSANACPNCGETIAALAKPTNAIGLNYSQLNSGQLITGMAPIIDAILMRAKKILDESENLTEFKERLLTWFPEAEAMDLAEILKAAMEASRLAGMYSVELERD